MSNIPNNLEYINDLAKNDPAELIRRVLALCRICDKIDETSLMRKELSMAEHINEKPILTESENGLCLKAGGLTLRPDFEDMAPRLRPSNLGGEIIVKAARFKNADCPLIAVDATAGLGEDSLLLAAAGFTVHMYERNPVISALLNDALTRALSSEYEILRSAAARMVLHTEDSISAMKNLDFIDII